MAYENKKISDIYALLSAGVQQEFNKKFRLLPKSFLNVIFKVFSGVYITLYKLIGWFFLQLFPATASWDTVTVLGVQVRPLVRWGVLLGIGEPNEATQWEGTGLATVVLAGSVLDSGTQLKSTITGKIYLIIATVTLVGATTPIGLKCSSSGTIGNLEVGDELVFVNPLGTIGKSVSITAVTTDAVDAETEAHYRARVVNRYQVQPQGGALADYRNWAADVDGVSQTYIYKDSNSATGVLIYVAGNSDIYADRIATTALCKAVGAACTYDPDTGKATRKPIGAILDPDNDESYRNVLSVSVKGFVVYVTGVSGATAADFADSAKSLIADYFLSREPYIRGLSVDTDVSNKVAVNNVRGIVNDVAESLKASFDDVTIKQNGSTVTSAAPYELADGELTKLASFYVNGVAY
jgi:uncharacterized phage protein gp47/JayE